MTAQREWIGRYRRAGNGRGIYLPLELRQILQDRYGWLPGDYIMFVPHDGLLIIRKVDKTAILERTQPKTADQRSK